jgi:DNA-binding response OmpR family regulator
MECITEEVPDLVIADVQLPGMSGIELCTWIKERFPKRFIPVILITCQLDLCNCAEGLNCGADEFVSKPFSAAELEAHVRALLRIKQLTVQLDAAKSELQQKERELIAAQIAGAAAHELGQPLTSLLLNFETAMHSLKEAGQAQGLAARMQEDCGRIRTILNSLKNLHAYKPKDYPGDLSIVEIK